MKNKKVFIIAEVGPNHNGSFKFAKKYINLLAESGVDAIKFQLSHPEIALSKDSIRAAYEKKAKGFKKDSDILNEVKKRQLTLKEHKKLAELCKKKGLEYMCSAFDIKSLKFLNTNLKIKKNKLPSGEIFSIDMLKFLNKTKKTLILSTGMSSLTEIEQSLKYLRLIKKKIILLHCISNYPTYEKDLNLRSMIKLKEKFNCEVGLSDHTLGDLAPILAVGMGASVIEKHVTINKKLTGPDHKNSMTVNEFKILVKKIRNAEKVLGKSNKQISLKEKKIAKVARKSIISKSDLYPGEKITLKKICFKRPGTGILPIDFKKIMNKKVKKFIEKDKLILKKNLY